MNKIMTALMLIFFIGTAQAQDGPSEFLQKVASHMMTEVEKNKTALKTDSELAKNLVETNLLPAIDTEVFARKTLSKKTWKGLSETQQRRFKKEFIDLVISSYASGLTLYDGQSFNFSKAKMSKTGKLAKVRSSMAQTGSTPIVIDYVLSVKSGNWKIIDLTIEGVNMSKSYKNQFLPRINSMGIEAFLADMEAH